VKSVDSKQNSTPSAAKTLASANVLAPPIHRSISGDEKCHEPSSK